MTEAWGCLAARNKGKKDLGFEEEKGKNEASLLPRRYLLTELGLVQSNGRLLGSKKQDKARYGEHLNRCTCNATKDFKRETHSLL